VYKALGAPKVWITLPGQGHIPPYLVGEASPVGKVVVLSTLDFFDQELKGDTTGLTRLVDVVSKAGPKVATLREDLG